MSDQSEEQKSKIGVRLEQSGKAPNFGEDSDKLAGFSDGEHIKVDTSNMFGIARKLFQGPNAISMQDLSSEENMKKLYNTFFR